MVKKIIIVFVFFIAGFIFGTVRAGIAAGRSVENISELDRQRDQLDRKYLERQRIIEDQQRGIGELVEQCINHAENAGAIIERTGANAGAAIGDLRAARAFIAQGIEEREALKMELDRVSSGLYGIRDMVRDSD